jgi:hypothetical protein
VPSVSTFTTSDDAALEQRIAADLDAVREELLRELPRAELDLLVLGGGYGRGEGGALATPDGLRPYNDYDLVLVHHASDPRRLQATLDAIGRRHSARTGIHVDVLPIQRRRLPRLPPALTWYELGQGHRVLWGDPAVLAPLVNRRLADVHPTEWGRLLVNRGSGLLFAQWLRAGFACAVVAGDDEPAFTTRQIYKGWLSLGDVWLAQRGQYDAQVRERARRFERCVAAGQGPSWADAYARAVDFKLRPFLRAPDDVRAAELGQLSRLYAAAMREHRSAPVDPARALWATLRAVPRSAWPRSLPLRPARERLRLAMLHELEGDSGPRQRLIGTREQLFAFWQRYG